MSINQEIPRRGIEIPSFFEMAGLSLGVAALSLVVGLIVREVFGVEI